MLVPVDEQKKTSLPWHILEVRKAMTFAKAFEALVTIDFDGTVALSDYANSTLQCFVCQRDDAGTRHEVSVGTRIASVALILEAW